MQISRFKNGGFVIHKLTGCWVGNVSAWFDADGRLVDAEQVTRPFGPSRPVKQGGPIWKTLSSFGIHYK